MEYSITNLAVDNVGENVYVKAFAEGVEMEQRENLLLVSVLFASYNHEKYVEASIRSIMTQEGVKFELIVIDDGSTDRSPAILEKLQKEFDFQYIHRPNKGLVATMNELLAMARGKYFCSFASDDIMPAGRLAEQSAYLENHPEVPACFGQIITMDGEGRLASRIDPRYEKSMPQVTFEEFFLGQKEIHGCSEMIRVADFREWGGYDGRIAQEDFQMILKLLSKHSPLPVIRTVCCHYRIHGKNASSAETAENVDKLYTNMLQTVELYRSHPLYKKAVKLWKMRWFSALAYKNKVHAITKLPELASWTPAFIKRLPKLLIPSFLLRH